MVFTTKITDVEHSPLNVPLAIPDGSKTVAATIPDQPHSQQLSADGTAPPGAVDTAAFPRKHGSRDSNASSFELEQKQRINFPTNIRLRVPRWC